jgi:hypothetical protein
VLSLPNFKSSADLFKWYNLELHFSPSILENDARILGIKQVSMHGSYLTQILFGMGLPALLSFGLKYLQKLQD